MNQLLSVRSALTVSVATSFAELGPLFRARARYPAVPEFFLSLDWFELLFQYGLPSDHELRIYIASTRDGEPLGALYCCRRLGSRTLSSLTSFYSVMYAPVMMSSEMDAGIIAQALVAQIAAERPRWTTVTLRFLRADVLDVLHLSAAFRANRFALARFAQYENWFAPVSNSGFAAYFASRPSQLRSTVRRRAKKASRQHHVSVRILTDTSSELSDGIASYSRVYDSSWKRPEPFPRFMPKLIERCAALHILRLGELRIDGIPVASQVWIQSNARAVIYKLAYDDRYKDLSVGSILSARLFEHALDTDRVAEIDYGVGSEGYKRDWMTHVRRIEGLRGFNLRTPTGFLLAMAESMKRLLRRAIGELRANVPWAASSLE